MRNENEWTKVDDKPTIDREGWKGSAPTGKPVAKVAPSITASSGREKGWGGWVVS